MGISEADLKKMELETIERYERRRVIHGVSSLTLGWGGKHHQEIRFEAVTQSYDLSSKSICDIGCGFSDLYAYLKTKGIPISSYKGVDINPEFVRISQENFPENSYEVRNFLIDKYTEPQADVLILLGLLNFKLKHIHNLDFTELVMRECFKIAKKAVILDFLSTDLTPDYPKEDFVFYHNPKDVMKMARQLTQKVQIYDEYPPIPQKEFLLILEK